MAIARRLADVASIGVVGDGSDGWGEYWGLGACEMEAGTGYLLLSSLTWRGRTGWWGAVFVCRM